MSHPIVRTAAALALAAQAAVAAPVPPTEIAERQLRALHHQLANAFLARDPAFVQTLVDPDFRRLAADGSRSERAAFIAEMEWPPAISQLSYDDVRVRLFSSVALLHAVREAMDGNGKPLRRRSTDVYHWTGNAWRLVAAQETTLRDGTGKALQRGLVPAFTPIPRHDGAGDDLATLRRLNEGYVQAFRDANPAWYDAHMAADYVVTNSDGSFVDRAGALAAFSRPAFATHFLRFPVDQVNIRRFGDVALIEAENAWTMKDGRSGVSRYTDIWHKEKDGRWRCVSAHITPVTLP